MPPVNPVRFLYAGCDTDAEMSVCHSGSIPQLPICTFVPGADVPALLVGDLPTADPRRFVQAYVTNFSFAQALQFALFNPAIHYVEPVEPIPAEDCSTDGDDDEDGLEDAEDPDCAAPLGGVFDFTIVVEEGNFAGAVLPCTLELEHTGQVLTGTLDCPSSGFAPAPVTGWVLGPNLASFSGLFIRFAGTFDRTTGSLQSGLWSSSVFGNNGSWGANEPPPPPPPPPDPDSDKDCLRDSVERSIGTDPDEPDSDGDRIPDASEHAPPLRYPSCEPLPLDLPALGADPLRPDVFVEVDWMEEGETDDTTEDEDESHRPDPDDIRVVVDAFKRKGINLHVDFGEMLDGRCGGVGTPACAGNALAHRETLVPIGTPEKDRRRVLRDVIDEIRDSNGDHSRRGFFHYALFAHYLNGCGSEAGGADEDFFVVALGRARERGGITAAFCDSNDPVSPPRGRFVSATFMHELGHNLGLDHGGLDDLNYKPNHLSVMNYLFPAGFELEGFYASPFGIDYSHFKSSLDERRLDETVGLLIPGLRPFRITRVLNCTKAECLFLKPDLSCFEWTPVDTVPIDWNCDGGFSEVEFDVNGDGRRVELQTVDEWKELSFDGEGRIGSALGVGGFAEPVVEITIEELSHLRPLIELDIKPEEFPNRVNPGSRGVIPMAILGSRAFDVGRIDAASLSFGPASALPEREPRREDANGDGLIDLALHVRTQDSGIQAGDEDACVVGRVDSTTFEACDSIETVPRRGPASASSARR